MYDTWSDEELKSRFSQISLSYLKLCEEVVPKLSKLSNMENELRLLTEAVEKRGLEIDEKKEPG